MRGDRVRQMVFSTDYPLSQRRSASFCQKEDKPRNPRLEEGAQLGILAVMEGKDAPRKVPIGYLNQPDSMFK